jgi:hypothetical protein
MRVAVTVDLDWASEAAIAETLDSLRERGIPVTVFATHRSPRVESAMAEIEVGLHPFFGEGSSHGASVEEVVRHVLDLPHNLPAFRCHRFGVSNEVREAMVAAGMKISSNVCTDLEVVPPFRERCGLVEVPIFLEDGGYLRRGRPLTERIDAEGTVVLLVHPMHFAVNTPHFGYMADIKLATNRGDWNAMSRTTLDRLRWPGRGIRDVIVDLLDSAEAFTTLGAVAQARISRA